MSRIFWKLLLVNESPLFVDITINILIQSSSIANCQMKVLQISPYSAAWAALGARGQVFFSSLIKIHLVFSISLNYARQPL